jgi:anthranilate phosphoribosyltransferase
MNAAVGLYVQGTADTITEAYARVAEVVDSGEARRVLEKFKVLTQKF